MSKRNRLILKINFLTKCTHYIDWFTTSCLELREYKNKINKFY